MAIGGINKTLRKEGKEKGERSQINIYSSAITKRTNQKLLDALNQQQAVKTMQKCHR